MSKAKQFARPAQPLTPSIFYILLSLATSDRHGYDIMKTVAKDSDGTITLGPGTLYGAIKRMLEEKLIVEVATTHTRRKYYRLTERGRAIFQDELERYTKAVELAKKRSLFSRPTLAKLVYAYV